MCEQGSPARMSLAVPGNTVCEDGFPNALKLMLVSSLNKVRWSPGRRAWSADFAHFRLSEAVPRLNAPVI